jgi:hypothetical protein
MVSEFSLDPAELGASYLPPLVGALKANQQSPQTMSGVYTHAYIDASSDKVTNIDNVPIQVMMNP